MLITTLWSHVRPKGQQESESCLSEEHPELEYNSYQYNTFNRTAFIPQQKIFMISANISKSEATIIRLLLKIINDQLKFDEIAFS